MNIRYKISVLLILIAGSCFSQIAGYMGKRFVVGYDMYFFPAIKGPGVNNGGPSNEFSVGLNTAHCLNIDYTIKQRTNFCFSFQYLKTGIAYRGSLSGGIDPSSTPYPYLNNIRYGGDFSDPAKLSSFNVGLGFKFFRKGEIAPVGKYQKLELLLFFETVNYNNTKFLQQNTSSGSNVDVPYTAGTGMYNYNNFALTYTIGKERIFYDKLVLDYGCRFGFTPSIIPSTLFQADKANTMEDCFRVNATSRLFREQLFNFHIGIGFLAF